MIGNDGGPILQDEQEDLFHVISYQAEDGKLKAQTLNTDLVDPKLTTTEERREVFLKHQANQSLFKEPIIFTRSGTEI